MPLATPRQKSAYVQSLWVPTGTKSLVVRWLVAGLLWGLGGGVGGGLVASVKGRGRVEVGGSVCMWGGGDQRWSCGGGSIMWQQREGLSFCRSFLCPVLLRVLFSVFILNHPFAPADLSQLRRTLILRKKVVRVLQSTGKRKVSLLAFVMTHFLLVERQYFRHIQKRKKLRLRHRRDPNEARRKDRHEPRQKKRD